MLRARYSACRTCPTPCGTVKPYDLEASCPLPVSRWPKAGDDGRVGLGDVVEKLAKPVAVALRMKCLDRDQRLLPESPCAKKREVLNEVRLWRRNDRA